MKRKIPTNIKRFFPKLLFLYKVADTSFWLSEVFPSVIQPRMGWQRGAMPWEASLCSLSYDSQS